MLERDYFIRVIEEFMAALTRFLHKDIDQRTDEDLADLYRTYLGQFDLIRNFSFEEALEYARDQWEENRRVPKLEMLAELWYVEGSYKAQPLRDMLLEKALLMFNYVDNNSKEFSIPRKNKVKAIKSMLGTAFTMDDTTF